MYVLKGLDFIQQIDGVWRAIRSWNIPFLRFTAFSLLSMYVSPKGARDIVIDDDDDDVGSREY